MSSKRKPAKEPDTGKPTRAAVLVTDKSVKRASGSDSRAFRDELWRQVMGTLWLGNDKDIAAAVQAGQATHDAMASIAPRDEVEAMLVAQMLSAHHAAMECMRRAMLPEQSFEGRNQNLKHGAKLMQLYEKQVAALDKRRGQGQQKITVEHVTVQAGGQAIVGNVVAGGQPAPAPPPEAPPPDAPALEHAPTVPAEPITLAQAARVPRKGRN
jgi:hypothetical protein